MSLFVGHIPYDTRVSELEDVFSRYGRITRCEVKRGGYGFVEFAHTRDAEDAKRACDGMRFLGGRMAVEWAKGKERRGANPSSDDKCFRCGGRGHWSRECRERGGEGVSGDSYRRDRDYGRDRSPRRDDRSRDRSRSPLGPRGDRDRSRSPVGRRHSRSRSPVGRRDRSLSPRDNRDYGRDRSRSPVAHAGPEAVGANVDRPRSPSPVNHE